MVSKFENEKSDLDDAREISAFLKYFKENQTVVLGNWIFLKNMSRYNFNKMVKHYTIRISNVDYIKRGRGK